MGKWEKMLELGEIIPKLEQELGSLPGMKQKFKPVMAYDQQQLLQFLNYHDFLEFYQ